MLKISNLKRKNFDPKIFYYSKTAESMGISNEPPQSVLVCLMILADKLQFIRDKTKHQMIITSCYRSPKLNEIIKGSPNSAHMQGLAADFIFKDKNPEQTCEMILKTGVSFDQLLIENKIVHFGIKLRDSENRLEIAKCFFDGKKWVKEKF